MCSTSWFKHGEIGALLCGSFGRLEKTGPSPARLLRSYAAAPRRVMPSVVHCTEQYADNRAEVSYQRTRQRERQMRRFKSPVHLQRFTAVHGVPLPLHAWARTCVCDYPDGAHRGDCQTSPATAVSAQSVPQSRSLPFGSCHQGEDNAHKYNNDGC